MAVCTHVLEFAPSEPTATASVDLKCHDRREEVYQWVTAVSVSPFPKVGWGTAGPKVRAVLPLGTVSNKAVGTVDNTGTPAKAAAGGIPPLPDNAPVAVVIVSDADCAVSFSSMTLRSSWVTPATAALTDSWIMA